MRVAVLMPLLFVSLLAIAVLTVPLGVSAAEEKSELLRARTWNDTTGQFQVYALLVDLENDKVHLKKSDGRVLVVPLEKLSEADRQWVSEHGAAAVAARQATRAKLQEPPAVDGKAGAPAQESAGLIESEVRRRALDYARRQLRDAYRKVNKTPPTGDEAALALLEGMAQAFAYLPPPLDGHVPRAPSIAQMQALSAAARKSGCNDPLVIQMTLNWVPRNEWGAPIMQLAQENLRALRQSEYAPMHAASAAKSILQPLEGSVPVDVQRIIEDGVMSAISAKEYQGLDRRFVLRQAGSIMASTVHVRDRVARTLAKADQADPWLRHMLLGTYAMNTALEIQNPSEKIRGPRPEVTDPTPQWQAARTHFLEAWKLHRGHPEPCWKMIELVSAGGGEPDDTVELWFDRARQEQFDCPEAYSAMRKHLIARYDGEGLYAHGVECLKTGRYDTSVPYYFITCLDCIRLLQGSRALWRCPDVYPHLRQFFRGNAQTPLERDMVYFATLEGYFAHEAGQFEDARQAFERAGDRYDRNVFEFRQTDAAWIRGRSFALGGPLRARVEAIEKTAATDAGKAAAQVLQLIAATDKADPALRYLRARATMLTIESSLARGEWASLQPDVYLSGWTPLVGQWGIDEKGALVGVADVGDKRGGILLCRANVGARFEVRGHAEIVSWEGGGRFGAVVGYFPLGDYWECSFFPGDTDASASPAYSVRGNLAYVRCRKHDNPHERPAKVARSDDFRIQVYDGKIATTVGAEIDREQAPMVMAADHDPPTDQSLLGLCVGRAVFQRTSGALTADMVEAMKKGIRLAPAPGPPTIVRFTDLKVRKLTAPPAEARLPEPK